MRTLRTVNEARAWRASLVGTLGVVPTMGFLHEGHLSLVRAARVDHTFVAATIFVNPAQFAPTEDLSRYPRDEARDLALLEREGVDAVFAPEPAEIYPDGFSTWVTVEGLTDVLEGQSRPGHFRGVTTVVLKLLNILRPDAAYFGQKDAQQLAVVRRMVRDLNLPTDVVGLPIVREPDGVAMSSRNVYLSPEQRIAARSLSAGLREAERLYATGERSAEALRACVRAVIDQEQLADIDYVSVADATTLRELGCIAGAALLSVAVRFGGTRLIDNVRLGGDGRTA